jgi:hypothetical protein
MAAVLSLITALLVFLLFNKGTAVKNIRSKVTPKDAVFIISSAAAFTLMLVFHGTMGQFLMIILSVFQAAVMYSYTDNEHGEGLFFAVIMAVSMAAVVSAHRTGITEILCAPLSLAVIVFSWSAYFRQLAGRPGLNPAVTLCALLWPVYSTSYIFGSKDLFLTVYIAAGMSFVLFIKGPKELSYYIEHGRFEKYVFACTAAIMVQCLIAAVI